MNEQGIINSIIEFCSPEKIYVHGRKQNINSGETSACSICVVVKSDDPDELERKMYVEIDSDIYFDLIVYDTDEWNDLIEDTQSYAYRISQKGVLVYAK